MINFKGEKAYTRGEIDYLGRKQTAQDPGHVGEAMDDREICHCLQVSACPCHRRDTVSVEVKTWALCDTPGTFPPDLLEVCTMVSLTGTKGSLV